MFGQAVGEHSMSGDFLGDVILLGSSRARDLYSSLLLLLVYQVRNL